MLAIPHLSQVSSMAKIDSKEAQMKSKAGICFGLTSHNKHTSFLLSKEAQAASPRLSGLENCAFIAPVAPKGGIREDAIVGAARIWLEKEPPRSIQTWDDLVAKFINQFFPPSKTTNLRNEITNFKQRFDESFSEAWDRFKVP
ncbi:reverse transcriptase domain-containing protein [Tanacetum coccineum]